MVAVLENHLGQRGCIYIDHAGKTVPWRGKAPMPHSRQIGCGIAACEPERHPPVDRA